MQSIADLQRAKSDWANAVGMGISKYSILGDITPGKTAKAMGQAVFRPDKYTDRNMIRMLASRMGWDLDEGSVLPFKHIHPTRLSDEQAVVFVVHNNTALTVYDDIGLYPSDALVTSLRLLLG